jgi:hypothetical protein
LYKLCVKTKQLAAMPVPGLTPQMKVTVGDATLFEWAAPPNGVAVGVLQQHIHGTPGVKVDFDQAHKHLAKINKGLMKVGNRPMNLYSQQSATQRLASPFFLPSGASYPEPHHCGDDGKTYVVYECGAVR